MRSPGLPHQFPQQFLIVLRRNPQLRGARQRHLHPPLAPMTIGIRPPSFCRRRHAPVPHRNLSLMQIRNTERIPKRLRQLLELQHLPRIRFFVHAVQRRNPALEQIPVHRAVRRQHELFNQPVRNVALAPHNVRHPLLFIKLNHRLRQIEIDRAMFIAPLVEQQSQLFHIAKMPS